VSQIGKTASIICWKLDSTFAWAARDGSGL
jgi:hypothetical protein